MADGDGLQDTKEFYVDVPQEKTGFFLKGCNNLDWGMKNRLARIFNPVSGNTVMLAVDHGYFLGTTTGLERIDLSILPLVPYADTLMLTRGILRSIVPPSMTVPIVIRSSAGSSILKELSNEEIAVAVDDALRLNVCAMAVQVFIGGESEVLPFDGVSLISAPYTVNNQVIGTLGVIGPSRMAYEKVIPLVDVTAKLLSRAMQNFN